MVTLRENSDLNKTDADHGHSNAAISDAGKEAAPMLKRASIHRERIDQSIRELETEKSELTARLDYLRRQIETIERSFDQQIADIDETLKLYEKGLNSIPMRTH